VSTAPIDHGAPAAGYGRDLPTPARALAIGAHPDDIEFGCGATLAKWATAGAEVSHLLCTDGSKGTWDPRQDPTQLVVTRRDEQRAAAKAVGGRGEVVFLGWPDGELASGIRQRWEVAYWIRRLRPDVVLGHDPWRRYRLHPDHRHAGFLAVDGVVAARDLLYFPEQNLPHHRPSALLLFEADEPDHVEDVGGHADAKLAALFAHESQYRSTMKIEPDDDGSQRQAFVERVRERLASSGALVGVAEGEAFKAILEL
jgi:LmbE family N-acetylglucosaminyl deacetylase